MTFKKITSTEILIHVFSLILMFMAGYFYLERTLPFDGAFYSFRIAETGWFCVDNFRYGVAHTQLLPLLFLMLGCSIKVFLISYSLSFTICNYIICLVVLRLYKQPKLSLGILLATTLSYTFKFFYPVSEIHSTVAPLFLFSAHVFHFENRKSNIIYFLVAALLISWILLIHLLSIIPAFFILVYYVSFSKFLKTKFPIVIFSAAFWGVGFILSKTFLSTQYLESKMIGMKEIMKFITDPNAAPGYIYFKNEFLFNYLPLEAAYLIVIVFLLLKKELLQLFSLLAFTLGTWLIIMAYNLNSDAPIVYMNYYCLFGIFAAFPFCMGVTKHITIKTFHVIYVFLFISSLVGIIRSGAFMGDQVNYYKRITSDMKTAKAIVHPANVEWNSVWVAWDLSFQSLLLSTLENPQRVKTFFASKDTTLINELKLFSESESFFNAPFAPGWFRPPFENKEYFTLPPETYTFINTTQDSLKQDTLLSNKNMEIQVDGNTLYLFKNNFRCIPVTIISHNAFLLPSLPGSKKQIDLSYHLYNSKKEVVFEDGKRSYLEADIPPNGKIRSGLSIDCTQLHRGQVYYIDIDLVVENKRWLRINKQVKLILI